jgi:TctA family transporter
LKFGAPEYFSLMLMGLVAAAVTAQGDMIKSLTMVAMGLLLGIVGTDVNSGMARFSFGIAELTDGIGFIVIAVGVFAIGEIIGNLGQPDEARCSRPRSWASCPRWRTRRYRGSIAGARS